MTEPTITEVENAFQPAKEISNASRFAGRKSAVSDAYYGLIATGLHLAIVGNRGIGKTSLSRQVANIATGDNDLLKKLDLPHDKNLDYLTVYYACGKTTQNTTDLLERLLTSTGCLGDWIYDVPKASKVVQGCVRAAAVEAKRRGYNVTVPSDAIGSNANLKRAFASWAPYAARRRYPGTQPDSERR